MYYIFQESNHGVKFFCGLYPNNDPILIDETDFNKMEMFTSLESASEFINYYLPKLAFGYWKVSCNR